MTPRWEWVFTALVVEPEQATLYLGDSGVLNSAVNPVSHEPEAFDSFTEIARDLTGGRYYRGRIDDVRIFDQALTPAQIQALYSATQ